MVVIDDIMALLRSENDRDHMFAQEFGALCGAFLAPALSLGLHLAHADRDLRRAKVRDRNWLEKGLAYVAHRHFLTFLRKLLAGPTLLQLENESKARRWHA